MRPQATCSRAALEALEQRRLLSISLVQPAGSTGLRPYGDGVPLNGKLLIPAQSLGTPKAGFSGSPPDTTSDNWWKMLASVYGSGSYGGGGGPIGLIDQTGFSPDGFAGKGLYLTDGTAAGTTEIFDGQAYNLRTSGGRVFFESGAGDIYVTDGTAAGTSRLVAAGDRSATYTADVGGPYVTHEVPQDLYWATAHGEVFYDGTDGVYAIDPANPVRIKLASLQEDSQFTAVGSSIYFVNYGSGYTYSNGTWSPTLASTPSPVLYRTDGTAAGTQSVTDLPGAPYALGAAGGKLYLFMPNDVALGIYRLDGTSTITRVTEVQRDGFLSASCRAVGGKLYLATGDGLFAFDPSTGIATGLFGGTVESLPVRAGVDGSATFVVTKDALLTNRLYPLELWTTDGTFAGTHSVNPGLVARGDLLLSGALQMQGAWSVGGTMYVSANNAAGDVALWTVDAGSPDDSLVQVVGNALSIRGHDNAAGGSGMDQITVEPEPGAFAVTINGVMETVPSDGVTWVYVDLRGGADSINLSRIQLPCYVSGGRGNDTIYGGESADTIDGGAGSDSLWGGAGDDQLFGGPGNDVLYGRAGNDTLVGGVGDDSLVGGVGNDSLLGLSADPNFVLPAGAVDNDTLVGNDGNDSLDGGADGDILFGGNQLKYGDTDTSVGNDFLYGGAGDDQLYGGVGSSILDGGDGNDSLWSAERGDAADYIVGGPGTDAVVADANDNVTTAEVFPH